MADFTIFRSVQKRALFIFLLSSALIFTLAAGLRYSITLDGIPDTQIRTVDSNWFLEDGSRLTPVEHLPCQFDFPGNILNFTHKLSDEPPHPQDVLVIRTRYQSIRVWADQKLIYESPQGREYALSTMWHFIPAEKYSSASALRVELTKYDSDSTWELLPVLQDHPNSIKIYLLQTYLPAVLTSLCCVLFTIVLIFITLFMAVRKMEGISLILSLAAFIFLSGAWILLDSKITTIFGGNYALTYFFSYCVFYLLPIPLLIYLQLILDLKNKHLQHLIWITAGNAGLWMLLHFLGIVFIRNTAWSVHLLIILFLLEFMKEMLRKGRKKQQKRLSCTFCGILLVFATALISILLYYTQLLPSANSGIFYIWGIFAMISCMTMDSVLIFERIWREKQYIQFYRQLATEDSMTKLGNRNAYEIRIRDLIAHPPDEVSFIMFDIDQMKHINDTYGHHAGDQVISLAAQCIHEVFGDQGSCYRIGGDEFCVILTSPMDIPRKLQEFDRLIQIRNQTSFPVRVSHGWEKRNYSDGPIVLEDIIELKTASDQELYYNKNTYMKY